MESVKIGNREVGGHHPCFVIGEIGLNHNGSVDMAKQLIDVAKEAGADCVKFQKRNVAGLAVESLLDADDNRFPEFGKTYRQIREHLEFDLKEYQELIAYTQKQGMIFLCTAFDVPSVEFLEGLGVAAYKVASHGLTNLPLHKKLTQVGKPVILSTGMCTLEEIDAAVSIYTKGKTPLILLHCVSSYPQALGESNLRMMDTLKERYQVPVGYSGHEMGFLPTVLSVARGACAVERHITLDTSMVGFDHKLSLDPQALKSMIKEIRQAEQILGSGAKAVSDREQITRNKYHVSMVASRDIKAGEVIEEAMLEFKNPGTGLPPSRMKDVIKKKAKQNITKDTLISLDMIEEQDDKE